MHVREFDEFCLHESVCPGKKFHLGGGIHPYAEVFSLLEGQVLLDWIGTLYLAEAPAVFLIAANTPHQIFQLSSLFKSWYIELEMEAVDEKPSLETLARWNELQTVPKSQDFFPPIVAYTLQSLHEGLRQQWHRRKVLPGKDILALDLRKLFLLVEDVVEQVDHCIYAEESSKRAALGRRNSQEEIYRLIRHIEGKYTTDISLAELSNISGLTSAYIIKLFKARTGMTPIQYVLQLRLNAAISYLHATQMPVQEIAERCGFLSLHYFSRLFKQKFGESPSDWRRRMSCS